MSNQNSELSHLKNLILSFRDERDWKQFHNIKDMILSLNLEASELLELCQWQSPEEIKQAAVNNKEKFANELADIFYWLLLISSDLEIDLTKAVEAKLKINEKKYPINNSKGSKEKYTKS